ncbi:MAG TPA: DoxX family protein [Gemmatimonadota bacterium]|nr:DoxX family protein [Gemmatimonadota bacterium]
MIQESMFLATVPTLELGEGSLGLLLARAAVGLGLAAHGAQKLFGWFGGHGPRGTGQFFEGLGFRPGVPFALAAGFGEFGGGLLLALGLFGPVGPMLVVTTMLVAILAVHRGNGFFAQNQGWELPLLYALTAAYVAFAGPGVHSLDAALGLESLWTATNAWIALAVAAVLAGGSLALRRPAAAEAAEAAGREEVEEESGELVGAR